MRSFGLLSDIDPLDPLTWTSKVFVTFDVDWAHDSVILDSAEIIESFGLRATWFFTHNSSVIERLLMNGHEVGIHPNFNKILSGIEPSTVSEVIRDCLSWCPGATSTRSHSLAYGALIASIHATNLVKYSSNVNIPTSSEIEIKPWLSSSGLIEAPYSWADEHIWGTVNQPSSSTWLKKDGLLVADFHPIHVFLNSSSSDVYEETRHCHHIPDELILSRQDGHGARLELKNICYALSTRSEDAYSHDN